MSDNTIGWSSCMSWSGDGEYRQGTVEMMNSPCVVVGYLRSEKDMPMTDGAKWNNKKWRCLFHWDEDLEIVFAGRQYPFYSPGALDIVRDIMINHLLPKYVPCWVGKATAQYSKWHNDTIDSYQYENSDESIDLIENSHYIVLKRQIVDMYKWIKNIFNGGERALHFNDLIASTVYTKPYYMYLENGWNGLSKKMEIGSDSIKCLRCGEKLITTEDTMLCPECEIAYGNSDDTITYPRCDNCGARFWVEDCVWVGDSMICPHCAENSTFVCERCGERHYNDKKVYIERCDQFWCSDCADEEE
jgi:hypothetical protein